MDAHQQGFGLHAGKAQVQVVRQPLGFVSVEIDLIEPRQNAVLQPVSQLSQTL